MGKHKDLTGQKFGKLTVLNEDGRNKHGAKLWKCLCECGKEITVMGASLTRGDTKSCGCLRSIAGKRFGRLLVVERSTKDSNGNYKWKCLCDCGTYKDISQSSLVSGAVKSCGCYHRESVSQRSKARLVDHTGEKFGMLTAVRSINKEGKKDASYWECICDCGETTEVLTANLVSGKIVSCGCYGRKISSENGKKNIVKAINALNYIEGTLVEGILPNKKMNPRNKTGVTGVYYNEREDVYVAAIQFKKKQYRLGGYKKLEDAAKIRKEAEGKLFGEFIEWFYEKFPEKKQGENKEVLLSEKEVGYMRGVNYDILQKNRVSKNNEMISEKDLKTLLDKCNQYLETYNSYNNLMFRGKYNVNLTVCMSSLFIKLMVLSGARVGILQSIKVDDIEVENKRIKLGEMWAELPDLLLEQLEKFLINRKKIINDDTNRILFFSIEDHSTGIGYQQLLSVFNELFRHRRSEIITLRVVVSMIKCGVSPKNIINLTGCSKNFYFECADLAFGEQDVFGMMKKTSIFSEL